MIWRIIPATLILFITLSVIVTAFFIQSCSHTVEVRVHDTDTVIQVHHDTIPGPAFLRFISILNNASGTSGIITLLVNSPQSKELLTDASQQMGKQLNPVPHDSTFKLYASFFYGAGLQKSDSITIPPLKSFSMTTIAFFSTGDPGNPVLFPVFADDSTRKLLPPKDFCYIRFINGLPDYPQPNPSVNMHIDDINAPTFFKDNVNYQELRNYVLLPAGNHTIYVRSETDITQSYSAPQTFYPGAFYTIRLIGKHADGTDQLVIDTE